MTQRHKFLHERFTSSLDEMLIRGSNNNTSARLANDILQAADGLLQRLETMAQRAETLASMLRSTAGENPSSLAERADWLAEEARKLAANARAIKEASEDLAPPTVAWTSQWTPRRGIKE